MRFRTIDPNRPPEEELIAQFGEARIDRTLAGRLVELVGGSAEDREQAKVWTATFLRRAAHQRPEQGQRP